MTTTLDVPPTEAVTLPPDELMLTFDVPFARVDPTAGADHCSVLPVFHVRTCPDEPPVIVTLAAGPRLAFPDKVNAPKLAAPFDANIFAVPTVRPPFTTKF